MGGRVRAFNSRVASALSAPAPQTPETRAERRVHRELRFFYGKYIVRSFARMVCTRQVIEPRNCKLHSARKCPHVLLIDVLVHRRRSTCPRSRRCPAAVQVPTAVPGRRWRRRSTCPRSRRCPAAIHVPTVEEVAAAVHVPTDGRGGGGGRPRTYRTHYHTTADAVHSCELYSSLHTTCSVSHYTVESRLGCTSIKSYDRTTSNPSDRAYAAGPLGTELTHSAPASAPPRGSEASWRAPQGRGSCPVAPQW